MLTQHVIDGQLALLTTTGAERDRLFDVVLAVAPRYADYEHQSGRTLPVVVLHPDDGDVLRAHAAGDELVNRRTSTGSPAS